MLPSLMRLVAVAALALAVPVLVIAAPQEEKPAIDRYGDPLPPHAVARLGTLRFRGINTVSQAAVVPGGKQILGLGDEPTILLWDAATGKEVRRFAWPDRRTFEKEKVLTSYRVVAGSFAVSPDGTTLAVGTADDSGLACPLLLFDVATSRQVGECRGYPNGNGSGYPLLAFVTPTLLVCADSNG